MAAPTTIRALLVGDDGRDEFREARQELRARCDVASLPTAAAAQHWLAQAPLPPHLIVVVQARPGQFSAADLDRLRRAAPLARTVGLLGSWCEGEPRTGKPWPATVRHYWYQWSPRLKLDAGRLIDGRCPLWGLPLTASDDERLLASYGEPVRQNRGTIALGAPSRAAADYLTDACRALGYTTVWNRSTPAEPRAQSGQVDGGHPAADAGIWHGTLGHADGAVSLSRFTASLSPAPVIAILDFPRVDDRDRALAAGAASVMGKPFLLTDLGTRLDDHIADRQDTPHPLP